MTSTAYTATLKQHGNHGSYYIEFSGGTSSGDSVNAGVGDTVEFASDLDHNVPVAVHFSPFTDHIHHIGTRYTIGSGSGTFTFHFSAETHHEWIDPPGKIIID